MKTKDSVWQGNFGYWQNLFIRQNLLVIGYAAWSGYLRSGQGMVVCEVTVPIHPSTNWSIESIPFNLRFIPQAQATKYLRSLDQEQCTMASLLQTIATYDPSQAIVVLTNGNDEVDVSLLQRLTTAPAQCYEQVQRRWAEFQSSLAPERSHS